MDKFLKENIWELYKKVNSNDIEAVKKNLSEIKCEENYKNVLSKRDDYFVESHRDEFNQFEYEEARTKTPFRKEEWICKMAVVEKFYQLNNSEKMEELEIELFVATLDESEEIEEDKRTKIKTIKRFEIS